MSSEQTICLHPAERRYDKGERRFKHVGRNPWPEIEFDEYEPKKWIGKCPSNLKGEDRERLLGEAMPASNGDRDLSVLKKLYAVHEGAIYEAQTSDGGVSYHGYPFRGKLSGRIIDSLRKMAVAKECGDRFEAWVKKHIVRHGGRT